MCHFISTLTLFKKLKLDLRNYYANIIPLHYINVFALYYTFNPFAIHAVISSINNNVQPVQTVRSVLEIGHTVIDYIIRSTKKCALLGTVISEYFVTLVVVHSYIY